jgi:hypothetical protein
MQAICQISSSNSDDDRRHDDGKRAECAAARLRSTLGVAVARKRS